MTNRRDGLQCSQSKGASTDFSAPIRQPTTTFREIPMRSDQTSMRVDEETRDALFQLKRSPTDSYDDILRKLLDTEAADELRR